MSNEETSHKADEWMTKAKRAAAIFSQLDQKQVDNIVKAVYEAGFDHRVELAKQAHEETGLGKWKDKVIKNVIATQFVYEDIKDLKTVGIISEDRRDGIVEIAQPMGPILAVIPVTNPTSTTLFKTLISLKTRNPIIICPHMRATKVCDKTAQICYEAALSAGAPEDCIQWLTTTSHEQTHAFMIHPDLALILATGGSGLVKAAYSSGTPTIGVGAGNVPVYIESSADIPFAVEQICMSKTFDNGTVCASEQAVVVEQAQAEQILAEFSKRGGYVLSHEEVEKLNNIVMDPERGIMSPAVVGQSALFIAEKAGITVPEDTQILLAPLDGIGDEYPISSEILAPILGFYVAEHFDEAVNLCIDLNFHGGMGHTASIFSNDEAKIKDFAMVMNAGRIVVNMPSSHGAVGGIFNTLHPSLTLGCGAGGKNITTDNVTAKHLLNIQRIARRRPSRRLEKFNMNLYFNESLKVDFIEKEFNRNY